MHARLLLIATLTLVVIVVCEKSPAPKFKPGDRVVTIMGQKGTVCLRTRLNRDDVYYIKADGTNPVLARMGINDPATNYDSPYDAADLRLLPK
jgi:hypothetical protein